MATNLVRVKKAQLIPPSEPTPSCTLSLSSLDSQLFLRFTIEYLLIYEPSHLDRTTTAAQLRAALAQALVPYYPLAGRVRTRSDCSGLEVLCRAQGAGFVEAVSDYTPRVFERSPGNVTEWRKLLSTEVFKVGPPLVVQLTWLADGSAALGVGFAHCLCDGIGSAEFLNLFAELATGKSRLGEFKPVPVWDRHVLENSDSPPVRTGCGCHPEFVPVPDTCGFVSRFLQEKLVPTSITFEKKWLNKLKKLASSACQNELVDYTSFEVLTAHIWRSWARALNLPFKQNLKLLFSVNIRSRVNPSLPIGYYGNAFVLGCAETTVKNLLEKGLEYGARLLKKAKEQVGDRYVKEVVESVSGLNQLCPNLVGVLIVSQWSRLGLDRVDFGMGKPVHVGPVCPDRYCIMVPVRNRIDAVKVMVAVPTSAVDRYENLMRCPYT